MFLPSKVSSWKKKVWMGWHDNEQLAKQTLHRIMRHHVKPISSRKWSLIYNGV